ncbi:hypothetical protein N9933_03315 [bacterium]|nr:hypothetical protein [bacterium]
MLLWTFVMLFLTHVHASNDPPPAVGARAISLGHAYTGITGDFWSLFHNPAGIAGIENPEAGVYFERRFGLKELTYGSAGFVTPFSGGTQFAGIELTTFGFDAYRENKVGLTYATRFFDKVSVGIKANYANVNIRDYGNASTFYVDLGLATEITPELTLGFSAYNVNRSQLETQSGKEPLPTVLTAGLAYQPTDKILFVADLQKDIDHPVSFRGGIEYAFAKGFYARLGTSTRPLTWAAGLGMEVQKIKFDFAFGFHERLGYSPHISLAYGF